MVIFIGESKENATVFHKKALPQDILQLKTFLLGVILLNSFLKVSVKHERVAEIKHCRPGKAQGGSALVTAQ